MWRSFLAVLFACAGCKFSVGALSDFGATAQSDLAGLTVDLAGDGTTNDLAAADLSTAGPPDLRIDTCAGAPALSSGSIAAQCVIGAPPTIDGDLSDWPLAQFLPMTKAKSAQSTGLWDPSPDVDDADASARFFVRWDLTYLYVAASMTDDVRSTPNATGLSNNDALEIFVDGLHNRGITYGSDDWQLVYSADGNKVAAQNTMVAWPDGTLESWGGTTPGWTLEVAIPWTLLGVGTPAAPGRVIGFDLKLDDNDGGSLTRARDLILYYAATTPNTCTAPFCRTDAFGAVQLQGR